MLAFETLAIYHSTQNTAEDDGNVVSSAGIWS